MRIPTSLKTVPTIPYGPADAARWLLPLAILTLAFSACGGSAEEVAPTPAGPAATLPAINFEFAVLPEGFEIANATDTELELTPTDPDATGRMWIEYEEVSDYGINLVQIVTEQGEVYALRENSEYFGGRKLVVAAAGEAYYVRGRYDKDSVRTEEVRLFLVHPAENRLVSLHYAYPAAEDSGDRIQELFAWVGEISLIDDGSGAVSDEPS